MTNERLKALTAQIRSIETELLSNQEWLEGNEAILELKTCVDDFRTTLWMTMAGHLPKDIDRQEFIDMVRMRRITEMLRSVAKPQSQIPRERTSFGFTELVQIAESTFAGPLPSTGRVHESRI